MEDRFAMTTGRKSGLPTNNLMARFNIDIGTDSIEDIELVTVNEYHCQFKNRKTGTIYAAEFTDQIQNQHASTIQYIKNTTFYSQGRFIKDSWRHIKYPNILYETFTILSGEYMLTFEKEFDEENIRKTVFPSDSKWFRIRLSKRNEQPKGCYQRADDERLYNQVFVSILSEKVIRERVFKVMEQLYLGQYFHPAIDGYKIDEYDYVINGNLIHGVIDNEVQNSYQYKAICMENSLYYNLELAHEYEPFGLAISTWKDGNPITKDVLSCFNYLVSFDSFTKRHLLHILKYADHYKILYRYNTTSHESLWEQPVQEFLLPTTNSGSVDEDDIDMIIIHLKQIFGDIPFVNVIIADLNTFRNKLAVKKGSIPDVTDILNPRNYIHRSFDDIISFITRSDYDFISLALNQITDLKRNMEIIDTDKNFN